MQERRSEPRRRTYLGGQIGLALENASVDCLVRNLSERGAKLILVGNRTLPAQFGLTIGTKGASYVAEVKWRHRTAIGVSLAPNLLSRVVSLEAERQRRLVAE